MEESTEAHMESDVPSTTEDGSETQEVTSSNGNVEMVIVVEQVKEEEMNASAQSGEQPPPVVGHTNELSSPSTDVPQVNTNKPNTLTKDDDKIEPSPSKPDVTQKVVNKYLQPGSEIKLSADVKPIIDADLFVKDALPTENVDSPKSAPNSPRKLLNKSPEKSPKKDTPMQDKCPEINPIQEAPIPVQLSPIKELQLSESTRSTPTSESLLVERFFVNGKVLNSDTSNDSSYKSSSAVVIPINIPIEKETYSNDSQLETNSIETNCSDTSEKEHNKSISRELKSLINSAKESKIISECTQLTSKTRKSRSALDTSSTGLHGEPDKIQNIRRNSNNSQKSSCSEKSEKIAVKRSMRSQNPEFVSKVKQFLNSVTGKCHKDSDEEDDELEERVSKEKYNKDKKDDYNSSLTQTPPKTRKFEPIVVDKPGKLRTDPFCWRCHWPVEQATNDKVHSPKYCTVCPRSFHYKCLSTNERNKINTEKSWVCPECMVVLQAESSETRSPAMKKISLGMLCDLLKHALERMMDLNGVEPFVQPVDRTAFPDYDKYVVHPMDLSLMRTNINDGLYGSTEAFLADAQWILHNSIIFNTLQSKLTGGARALVRGCRAEMGEIEACPECYAAAHARRPTWFTDVCTTPHILLWAKLKGFPYWPAKGMSVSSAGHVDVRFFGAHDRAWVPAKDCFLYSEKDPNNFRTKRQDIIDSMQEAEEHIRNISRKYGKFVYPPFKTPFDQTKLNEQLKMMIPTFEGEVRTPVKEKNNTSPTTPKDKSRSNSKSSKSSYNDGDMSESEDTQEGEQSAPVPLRKMADGAEIAREEEDSTVDKSDTTMDIDSTNKANESQTSNTTEPLSQSNETSRKRRRSQLVEAVITIMDSTSEPKRRKTDNKHDKDKKKLDEQESNSSKENEDKTPADKAKNGPVEDDDNDEQTFTDNEPSSSTRPDPEKEKNLRVTPIRIALVQKDKGHNLRTSTVKEAMAKIITPIKDKEKEKESDKTTPVRQKSSRTEKTEKQTEKTTKDDKQKSEKRRNSRNNRSLNSTPKNDKQRSVSLEKKSEKTAEASSSKDKTKEVTKENKDKSKDNSAIINKEREQEPEKQRKEKVNSPKPTNSEIKTVKDRLQFDDDRTLAVIAREAKTVVISHNSTGLPTISCVRSLSTIAQNTSTTTTKVTTTPNTTSMPTDIHPEYSIFIPSSTDSLTNAKDAATKLQKLRNDVEPMVGRVGVRAFARMTSPERSPEKNDDVEVEIKAEPLDVEDADRQMEKLNLMNAFRLRPVNPPPHTASNLREVRINKVLVTPLNAKKTPPKPVEVRPRAKKTFPQPKKPEDGQLNSKNSMVYIPIQPPMTQAPVRPPRVMAAPTCHQSVIKSTCTSSNSLVNTVTTPVMQVSSISNATVSSSTSTSTSTSSSAASVVPAAVHTVPLMTSVNGQWMFSFQPVMSVGAIENSPSPPILNGVAERGNTTSIVPVPTAAAQTNPAHSSAPPGVTAPPALHAPASKTSTDSSAPGEPPRLQQRPVSLLQNPLDASTPIGNMPPPSTAGPVTAKLNQNAVKLTDFFRTLLEDSLEKIDEPSTQLTTLRLQLEQTKWKHQAEIKEIKHNHDLTLAEMRALFEKEKGRAVAEARRTAQVELEAAVKAAKSKQWCANCSQEAQFYCCWNTSYCDYPCQRAHWSQHFNVCTQQRQDGSNNGEPPIPTENRLQPQPDNLPKNSSAPALTVGGKLAPSRVFTQDPSNPSAHKNAIIVSMIEDQSGNQTMKCVGTYKPAVPSQNNISPIIINNQIMNSEENANKKVVSSGGYLIVGGGTNNSAVVTPARRTHTIQYYS